MSIVALTVGVLMTGPFLGVAGAQAPDEIAFECEEDVCRVSITCDGEVEGVEVCVSWDPRTADSFIPRGDSRWGFESDNRIKLYSYRINTPAGYVDYRCAGVQLDATLVTPVGNEGVQDSDRACFGGLVAKHGGVDVSPQQYVQAPPDIASVNAIQLCDGTAKAKVFGIGVGNVPFKVPC